jgi:hypothetical protein
MKLFKLFQRKFSNFFKLNYLNYPAWKLTIANIIIPKALEKKRSVSTLKEKELDNLTGRIAL